jgi:hypothetical protein
VYYLGASRHESFSHGELVTSNRVDNIVETHEESNEICLAIVGGDLGHREALWLAKHMEHL